MMFEAFEALADEGLRLIVKFDPEKRKEGVSGRVMLRKWIPQQDILGENWLFVFG